MRNVEVETPGIRLGQLLKLAGLVDSGGEAGAHLSAGAVRVGGAVETRRGRQLHDGDVVTIGDETVRVVVAAERPGPP